MLHDQRQETVTIAAIGYRQLGSHGLGHIRIAAADTQIDALLQTLTTAQAGYILTGVVGAREAGGTAMVGRDDQQIVIAHLFQDGCQLHIEAVQGIGIARNIVSVTIQHIKVHQIHKAQTLEVLLHALKELFHIGVIALVGISLRHTPSGKNIVDLADADDVFPDSHQDIQDGISGRRQGEIMAVDRSCKGMLAHEGTGNDTAHAVFTLKQIPSRLAMAVQLLHGHNRFMGSDLEHAVGRGVDDQLAGGDVLLAVVLDDLGAGIGQITQRAPPGSSFKLCHDLPGEALGISGHSLLGDHARQLPVPHGGILSGGLLHQSAVAAGHIAVILAEGSAVDPEQTKLFHVGNMQSVAADAGAHGITACIMESGGIIGSADTSTVENN